MDASEKDDEALIGEECHIIAKELDGPRGDHPLPAEARNNYTNLILLCGNHHTLIDKQPNTYIIQYLRDLKAAHEKWVREALQGFDPAKQRDDELYAEYLERWAEDVDLDNWMDWTGNWIFMSTRPKISYKQLDTFEELEYWLLSRIWPRRYPELDAAFENFRRVLHDLVLVHYRHSTRDDDFEYSVTDKYYQFFYRSDGRKLTTEQEQREEYDLHFELLADLMLELTRATNYICDKARQYIDSTFRMREGIALVVFDIGVFYRTEYQSNERELYPYPGFEKFDKIRKTRDLYFPSESG